MLTTTLIIWAKGEVRQRTKCCHAWIKSVVWHVGALSWFTSAQNLAHGLMLASRLCQIIYCVLLCFPKYDIIARLCSNLPIFSSFFLSSGLTYKWAHTHDSCSWQLCDHTQALLIQKRKGRNVFLFNHPFHVQWLWCLPQVRSDYMQYCASKVSDGMALQLGCLEIR